MKAALHEFAGRRLVSRLAPLLWIFVAGGCDVLVVDVENNGRDTLSSATERQQSELENAKATQQRLFALTTPGALIKTRLHVSNADTPRARELAAELSGQLGRLRGELLEEVTRQRAEQAAASARAVETASYAAQRALVNDYDQFIRFLGGYSLVYDSDWLGGLRPGSAVLEKSVVPVELSSFDFTVGFAKECRSSWGSGLLVHLNRQTGEITWHDSWKSGVAITGTDGSGQPQVSSKWKTGIASAYDPIQQRWVVVDAGWKTPVAAAFDASQGRVVSKQGGWRTGIAGVYNPITEQVEWHTGWSSGVAGYFDPDQQKVVWMEHWKSGVACIWRDVVGQYFTSSGFFGGEVDDDD